MGRSISIAFLTLVTCTCFGQFNNSVPGIYISDDIGLWKRVLVLKPDSTYFFFVDTDLGGHDYVEPKGPKFPTWTFNNVASSIVLDATSDYKPKIKTFNWDTLGLKSGTNKKLRHWVRIADFDSLGHVKTFKDGNEIIVFQNGYQPLYSEYYIDEDRKVRVKYIQLAEKEMLEFQDKYIKRDLLNKDLYSAIRSINRIIERFFPRESSEEIIVER